MSVKEHTMRGWTVFIFVALASNYLQLRMAVTTGTSGQGNA
jgi:hypothetical protein